MIVCLQAPIQQDSPVRDLVAILQDRGIEVRQDHLQLSPGSIAWEEVVATELAQSSYVVAVITSHYRIHDQESDIGLRAHHAGIPIILFWVDGEMLSTVRGYPILAGLDGRGINFPGACDRLCNLMHVPLSVAPESNIHATLSRQGFQYEPSPMPFWVPPVCVVPTGPFEMGNTSQQQKERSSHRVDIPKSYAIGQYPVTVAEYACAVRAYAVLEPKNVIHADAFPWSMQLQHPDHPVVNVSFSDAMSYTTWLSQVTGHQYRLATEAEWEKAARGIDRRIYPWGNQWEKSKANTSDDGPRTTTPVGSYPQGVSPYGCYDMAGNVWEWTMSPFGPYPYDPNYPLSPTKIRILRGGAWYFSPSYAQTWYRFWANEQVAMGTFGFRLLLENE